MKGDKKIIEGSDKFAVTCTICFIFAMLIVAMLS